MKQKQKQTTTPTNPEWVTSGVQNVFGQVNDLSKLDPYELVPGSNPLLDRAQSTLMGDPFAGAREMITAGANGGGSVGYHRTSDFMDDYQDPFLKDVLDSTLADFDADAGRRTAQLDLDLAGSPFRGSGSAITRSMLGGELARGRASTAAGIKSDAFKTAAELGSGDAARFTSADATNAQLAESAAARKMQGGTALAGLTSQEMGQQLTLGTLLREIEGQKKRAPLDLLQTQVGLTAGLPLNLFSGSKTTGTTSNGLGGVLGGLGTGLFGLGSMGWKPFG